MTHICRCSSKSVVQTAWILVLGVKSRPVLYRYYHNSTNVQLVETHWTGNLLCHLYSGRYRRENWSLHRPFGPHLPGLYMFVSKVYWYCYNLRCYRCAFKAQTAYFIFWWEPTAMIPFCHNGDVLVNIQLNYLYQLIKILLWFDQEGHNFLAVAADYGCMICVLFKAPTPNLLSAKDGCRI